LKRGASRVGAVANTATFTTTLAAHDILVGRNDPGDSSRASHGGNRTPWFRLLADEIASLHGRPMVTRRRISFGADSRPPLLAEKQTLQTKVGHEIFGKSAFL
jgi:hypothetical protein